MTQERTRSKADAYFSLYYQMGAERTLSSLFDLVHQVGIRISLKTLERYSADFSWQSRVADLDRKAQERLAETQAAAVAQMNSRQATLGKAMQDIAGQRFEALARDIYALEPQHAARVAKIGADLERMAMGEATTRSEIEVRVYTDLIFEIRALFLEVNSLDSAETRAHRFALGVDSLIEAHVNGMPAEHRGQE